MASSDGPAASRRDWSRASTPAGEAATTATPSPRTGGGRLRQSCRSARLVTVHQVHSALVVEAGDWPEDDRPQADALVTDRPGVLLGILTADCAPVLLADREAGVVGAAHAGWRGALIGVGEATVAAMERLGARRERIAAAVGPCIAARNYEVDHGFHAMLTGYVPDNERFFTDGPAGKPHFDLEAYVAARLAAAGVRTVETHGPRHLCHAGALLQLPARDPSRRARLRAPDQPDRTAGLATVPLRHGGGCALVRAPCATQYQGSAIRGAWTMLHLRKIIADSRGATAIEYALIASLISVAAIAGYHNLGGKVGSSFADIEQNVVGNL